MYSKSMYHWWTFLHGVIFSSITNTDPQNGPISQMVDELKIEILRKYFLF